MWAIAVLATAAAAAWAAGAETPYAGEQERPIKALSPAEVAGYLAGEGMGFAKVAELNHYPGPRHVLDLAGQLDLTAAQRVAVEAAWARMHERAVALGRRLVDAEASLDAAFAAGEVAEDDLLVRLREIAALGAELRHAHLAAHLATRAVLREEQVAAYDELRGYGGTGPAGPPAEAHPGHPGHPGHHGHAGHGGAGSPE
jgi:hypothetical protein